MAAEILNLNIKFYIVHHPLPFVIIITRFIRMVILFLSDTFIYKAQRRSWVTFAKMQVIFVIANKNCQR